jgi:two-component sensor histidine kinase
LACSIRSFICGLLLLGANLAAAAQSEPAPIKYQFRNYPLDTLLLLRKQPGIPDTLRVFYLNRLSFAVSTNDLPSAVQYIREAIKLSRQVKYVRGELNCLKQLGNYYSESGDFTQAHQYYQEGAELAMKHNKPEQLSRFYVNMGAMAARTGDNDRSLKYLFLSLQEFRKSPAGSVDLEDSAHVFSNIANTYRQMGRWSMARQFAKKSLRLYQQLPAGAGLAQSYDVLAHSFAAQAGTSPVGDSAGYYYKRLLALHLKAGDNNEAARNLSDLAIYYQHKRQYVLMRDAALRSLTLAQKVGAYVVQANASRLLATAYQSLGNYREALAYSEQASALNTIAFDNDKAKEVAQMQVKFDVKTREHQINVLEQEATLAAKVRVEQEQRQRWLLQASALLGLCLFGAGVLYWRLQKSQAEVKSANGELVTANQELRVATAEKEVLVQEIHHRVKNNLQMVRSLLSWQTSVLPDPALAGVLANTQNRIQSMALVHEHLYQSDNLAQVRIDTYLGELLGALHLALTSPDQCIEFTTEIEPMVMEPKQASALGVLISELITNAYKHAFKGRQKGRLHIACLRTAKGFHLRVIDDGVGIVGTTFKESPQSLGIQIVKSLTKQLKATLEIVPQLPNGVSVEVISK